MTINIIQTITNILNEDKTLKSSSLIETYLISPSEGKVLKNVKTGEIIKTKICLNKKIKINDYIEINKPNMPE